MKVKALTNIELSGSELANKEDMQQAINKAFVCEYFKVKPNTPDEILKVAIKHTTGANMSFGQFKSKVASRKRKNHEINQRSSYKNSQLI